MLSIRFFAISGVSGEMDLDINAYREMQNWFKKTDPLHEREDGVFQHAELHRPAEYCLSYQGTRAYDHGAYGRGLPAVDAVRGI